MQKLKNSIVQKMIAAKCTSKEVDFVLYVSRFQDDYGKVSGIHYKEVCDSMGMSHQGFYDVKASLQEKNIIRCEKSDRIDHDITIIGNEFLTEDDIKSGYVNTNHNMFYQDAFFGMKAGAKLLAMELLALCYSGSGQHRIGVDKLYEKYATKLSVTRRVIRIYLAQLKEYFSISIVDGLYYIRPKKNVYRQPGHISEADNFASHNVAVICRRNRIKDADKQDVSDVMTLIRQYRTCAEEKGKNIIALITVAVERSIEVLKEKAILKPKLIHSLLREELELENA